MAPEYQTLTLTANTVPNPPIWIWFCTHPVKPNINISIFLKQVWTNSAETYTDWFSTNLSCSCIALNKRKLVEWWPYINLLSLKKEIMTNLLYHSHPFYFCLTHVTISTNGLHSEFFLKILKSLSGTKFLIKIKFHHDSARSWQRVSVKCHIQSLTVFFFLSYFFFFWGEGMLLETVKLYLHVYSKCLLSTIIFCMTMFGSHVNVWWMWASCQKHNRQY